MKIAIIGAGYVGIATGFSFVKMGYNVTFVEKDAKKVELINRGMPPIYERGLEEIMTNYEGQYWATRNYQEAIEASDICFICVGTPSTPSGDIDLHYIKNATHEIGKSLRDIDRYYVIVVKSTVLPGTTKEVIKPILEKQSGKRAFQDFGLAVNPEFLREGCALRDFLNPDRIILGVEDKETEATLRRVYKPIHAPILIVDIKTAEMIKYVSNAFLATKISFANEIGNICKKLGIDSWKVFRGVGMDHRISPYFFRSGIGFGGSCFPKDVRALIRKAEELGENPLILKAVVQVNEKQPLKLIKILKQKIPNLKERVIGVLGLAFKPNTDDIRESRAIPIIQRLLEEGAKVIAYDPKATENFRKIFPQITYVSSAQDVLKATDVILILTEWEEFENLDFSGKIVIDGRRIKSAEKTASIYEGVCW